MKVRSVSISDELQILKGCIVDRTTLRRVASLGDVAQFKNKYAQLVYGWCLDHLNSYDEAPGKESIESSFVKYCETKDASKVESHITKLLDRVDGVEVNKELIADKIGTYFSRNSLNELRENIEDALLSGDVETAATAVSTWKRVEVGKDASIDVLRDGESMREAFENKKEPLVTFSGGLGKFIGDDFCREGFISFMGPEKRGKTFAMMDVAWRAMQQKRKVAFIGLGDMSKPQYMLRFAVRASKRPQFPGKYMVPKQVSWDEEEKRANVDEWSAKTYETSLSWQEANQNMERIVKRQGVNSPLLKLSAYANSTMSVDNIEGVLDSWDRDGWVPDVIVIDYADLLLPPRGASDERSANNMNWKQLRKISQERHCLIVTATQASAASYDSFVVTRSHFSEDKRKLAHVTGMIGLNQTEDEKDDNVMRWNWIVRRDASFNAYECCVLGEARAFGTLHTCSSFRGES